ncbi:MAG: outer rane lipoprotein carrier protein LolA [Acidobacteria bacterium]|nr:outer rane lipoprotein carrier protein LolA [Acidobacteriota bacterium]
MMSLSKILTPKGPMRSAAQSRGAAARLHGGGVRRIACSLAALLLPALLPAQGDLASAVEGLQKRYATVTSLRAEFQQHYRGPGIDQKESGTVFLKKPGLMRWEYRDPEIKLFVADGRDTYLYVPADRQVQVRRVTPADLNSTPLQFLLGRGDIRESFDAAWEPGTGAGGALLFRLTPRSADTDYAYVVIECDTSRHDIRRMVIHERTGATSEFVLSKVATNVRMERSQFEFKIPEGVEVVRIDEK